MRIFIEYISGTDNPVIRQTSYCRPILLQDIYEEVRGIVDRRIGASYRDSLTKTYSCAYLENFMPNLEQVQGVIVVDVDKFKEINDTYGHVVGDEALKHIKRNRRNGILPNDS